MPVLSLCPKVGDDTIVAVHGDGGGGSVGVGDTRDVPGPRAKLVTIIGCRYQLHHTARRIGEGPFSRTGYVTPRGAGDGELARISTSTITRYDPYD